MSNWENKLISGDELASASKIRGLKTIQETVPESEIPSREASGWSIKKNYAHSARMEKDKAVGDAFEDEVWSVFYKMGFATMNSDRHFCLDYGNGLSKQIDVVAIDDEVCLLVECKATAEIDKVKSWKTDLEAISGFKEKLFAEIKTKYPNLKCKYIFATKNYLIGDQDNERMKQFGIANFDYETILYYNQLVDHLGKAARYQLLGNIFAKQTIESLNDEVPAIQGTMAGLTYYSFLIEPSRLLKVAYVLHRNKANHDMMPTYQRLIKKNRLDAIRGFVNEGGYFPNSLIVSIDTNGSPIQFDESETRLPGASKLGVLHLPKMYQSVYVIDGQHRLYGYSETQWADVNTIPVVAFVDLPNKDQVKMFMDINQNQKQVSKTLRNTLNIDLLWDADSYSDRLEALMLNIAQDLGEKANSPLHGRVITGEDAITNRRCITLEYIKEALKQTKFFNTYKKKNNDIVSLGTFDRMDNDRTRELFFPFLCKCFQTIKDYCSNEWEKGAEGFLTINNCTYALIRIFDDITNIVLANSGRATVNDPTQFYSECEPLLLSLCDTINSLDPETINVIKKSKGGGAKKDAWRKLQVAFHAKDANFINDDLQHYIQENCVDNDAESESLLEQIEQTFKAKIWKAFPNKERWGFNYLPRQIWLELVGKAARENSDREGNGIAERVTEWDLVSFPEISALINFGSNWSDFLQQIFFVDEQRPSKIAIATLLRDLTSCKNKLSSAGHILSSQFEELNRMFNKYVREVDPNAEGI